MAKLPVSFCNHSPSPLSIAVEFTSLLSHSCGLLGVYCQLENFESRGKREFHLKNGLWPFCENVLIDVGRPSTISRQVSLGCVREPAKSELEREPVYIPLCWVSGARCLPSFYVGAEGEGGSHACVCALNTLR